MRKVGTSDRGLVGQTSRQGEEGIRAGLESLTRGQGLERQAGTPFTPQIFFLHSAAARHLIASG